MPKTPYLTAPLKMSGMPPGVPYIIGNEAAERFSYYGMNGILVTFMTEYMRTSAGQPDLMTKEQASVWYHSFVVCMYFLPFLGAVLSDAFLGKYRTILTLSIVYCFGHLVLALNDTRYGLMAGLALIALGAGGIKPCVSANVGDQFGPQNQHLLPRVFSWFYFSINLGSAVATLLIPVLLKRYGPQVAFGVPGIAMAMATAVFWAGRHRFAHLPPAGTGFLREAVSRENLKAFGNLLILVPFVGMFWGLWQQNFSSWVLQAKRMDLRFMGVTWEAEQIQTANAVLILIFLPLFAYWVYPAINRFYRLNELRKIGIGLFVTVGAFLMVTWIETRLAAGAKPSIGWQLLAYVILTAGEILVSVSHLEFCYTQAPKKLKSFVMATYLLSISAGNFFTALVNKVIQTEGGTPRLEGPAYFLFFAGAMFITAVLYIGAARLYRGKTYIQDAAA